MDALVNLLYDATLDENLWSGLASKIALAFDSTSTVLKLHSVDDPVQLVEVTDNLKIAPKNQLWATHWHRNDLWVERSVAFGMSRVIISQDLIANAEFERTGFYQDWNRHLGIYHMVGAVFPVEGNTTGVLGIHRARRAGPYLEADRKRVARFLPHLNRALRIRRRFLQASLAQHASLDALDRLDTAVVVVDKHCRVLHTNGLADCFIRSATSVRVHGGRLALTNPTLDAKLGNLVQKAVRTAAGAPEAPGDALAIDRPDGASITVLVTPLRAAWDHAGAFPPAAMVFIRDPEADFPGQRTLRELFGLTRKEAAITAALVEGQAPEQIATGFRIGIGTVRSHLKMVLAKTGTHRQAQLVALVTRGVAGIGPARAIQKD